MGTLLHFALANALLATILAGVVYLLGKRLRHPPLMHALWVLVLLKFVAPPMLHWPLPDFPSDAAPVAAETSEPDFSGETLPAAATVEIGSVGEMTAAEPAPALDFNSACRGLLSALPMIWLLGALICLGLYWRRRSQLRQLLRHARPAPEDWQEQARALAARLGLRRCPTVLTVPGRVPPMVVFGFGGPRIVLPNELVGSLGTNRRAALLLHELAHLRRGDRWIRWLEMLVRILYWWYPPVAWIGRQLRVAEEQCCDSLVVTTLPEGRQEYAAVLLDTVDFVGAALSSRAYREALAMSSFLSLKRRVTMVLRESFSSRLSPRMVLVVAGLALLVLPFGLSFASADKQEGQTTDPAAKPPVPAKTPHVGGYTKKQPTPAEVEQARELQKRQFFVKLRISDPKSGKILAQPQIVGLFGKIVVVEVQDVRVEMLVDRFEGKSLMWTKGPLPLLDSPPEQTPYSATAKRPPKPEGTTPKPPADSDPAKRRR